MKLPIPFISQKKEQAHYYLALLLSDEKTTAVILDETEGKLKILSLHDAFFPSAIDTLPLDDLVDTVDKAVSSSEEVLPPDIETHKTVFGVKDTWVEEESKKIKKEQLGKLKKLCDSLDLTPLGFMVTTEAIANYLQKEEGAPLSAILAQLGRSSVMLTLYRGGKIVETIRGSLDGSVPHVVDTLLKHFTTAVLPARIIIFDGRKDDEALRQMFIAHQWSKSLPFLHVPQVTVLPALFDAQAVTFGAATQMGLEIAEFGSLVNLQTSAIEQHEEAVLPTEKEKVLHEKTEQTEETEQPVQTENFGFILNQDIALEGKKEQKQEGGQDEFGEEVTQVKEEKKRHEHVQTSGPVVEEGVQQAAVQRLASEAKKHLEDGETSEEELEEPQHTPGKKRNMFSVLSIPRIPKLHFPVKGFGKFFVFLIPLLLIIVIAAGVIYFYLYKVRATVVLTVKPKMVEQTTTVIFSTTSANDFSNNTIAAKSISAVVDGQQSAPATGSKEVGNKATGTVTLYNNSSESVQLSGGSTITSSNNLVFLLDKDISVSSASGDIFTGTKPGTGQVSVTAKEIGTEYNLPSATRFSIGDNSNLAARNDTAFSGGSKKEVTVVSKDDISKLKNTLLKSLQDQGTGELTKSASSTDSVLPIVLDASVTKANFSKNPGDEAKTVSVTGTVSFSGLSYANEDLNQYAQTVLKGNNAQNITFSPDSIRATVSDPKVKNNTQISAKVDAQAGILPNIDTGDVLQKIQGKSLAQIKDSLSGLAQISDVTVNFTPNIPLLPHIFPKLPNNVSVEVKSQ